MIIAETTDSPTTDAVLDLFEVHAGFGSAEFVQRDAAGEFAGHTWALAWRMVLANPDGEGLRA